MIHVEHRVTGVRRPPKGIGDPGQWVTKSSTWLAWVREGGTP